MPFFVSVMKYVRILTDYPVSCRDEIDKIGHASNHGDPAAALLEVLDAGQNHAFTDHYVNVPVDLSKRMIMLFTKSCFILLTMSIFFCRSLSIHRHG